MISKTASSSSKTVSLRPRSQYCVALAVHSSTAESASTILDLSGYYLGLRTVNVFLKNICICS